MDIEIPRNIFESEYWIYKKMFSESQINHLKRESFLKGIDHTTTESFKIHTNDSRESFRQSRMISIDPKNKEINRSFFEVIDISSRVELIKFFKSSNNDFVSRHNHLLTMDEYIELLDIEVE